MSIKIVDCISKSAIFIDYLFCDFMVQRVEIELGKQYFLNQHIQISLGTHHLIFGGGA